MPSLLSKPHVSVESGLLKQQLQAPPILDPSKYLPLGEARIVYLEQVSAWASKLRQDCVEAADPCPPVTLNADDVEALERFQRTLPNGCGIKGVYAVDSPSVAGRYLSAIMDALGHGTLKEEAYMFHGASLPALANIIEEGFRMDACNSYPGGHVWLSNRSSYSFQYASGVSSRAAPSSSVHSKVQEHLLELGKRQGLMKKGTMPALPLLAEGLADTTAILVCKVLVTQGFKRKCNKVTREGLPRNYHTSKAAGVCPHFLVHIKRG